MSGNLYLIPTPLGRHSTGLSHPPQVVECIHRLSCFAVEKLPSAVRFLASISHPLPEFKIEFHPLDKHSGAEQLLDIIRVLQQGADVGVLSEAGCPGIADPGAQLAAICHQRGISVVPLTGPSAVTLSVMASGLNGQKFAFNGYLPVSPSDRDEAIKKYEQQSRKADQTQVFIEAPHRNMELFAALCAKLADETRLCLASDLLGSDEWVKTKTVTDWKKNTLPDSFSGNPCMFLFLAAEGVPESGRQSIKKQSGRPRFDSGRKNKGRRD
jgi:16S rRNA (cytidine1402-2'-O)-methyltransferase